MITRSNLIVFSDDWGRHPSSCQHLVSHLCNEFDVTWINTIGTRPPRIDLTTIRRGCEKLRHWRRRSPEVAHRSNGPRVINPVMWPSFGGRWQRWLNRNLVSRCLESSIPQLANSIILTTVPIVADLVGHVDAAQWIYYCVDDFATWPGLDGRTLERMEAELVERADTIVAAGENLAQRIRQIGREPVVITHGVDLEHWRTASFCSTALPALKTLEHPLALFWGLIDQRLDVEWLRTLASEMTEGSIVLVGPEQAPDAALESIPRLHRIGSVPFDDLPGVANSADVLIMPYADLPVTRAMQPLKLKEYLATGKPVVVRRLPATEEWDDCLDAVNDAVGFAAAVRRRWQSGLGADQTMARRRLVHESWSSKSRLLRDVFRPAYIDSEEATGEQS